MKRILIIEDDPAILLGLNESLAEEHFEVLTAMDGEEGFRIGKKENIDLIILDIVLPSKNGIEICKDLREFGITIPILMLTSKREEIDKVLGLEIGADDYVTKPFSIRELIARIKALLRRNVDIKKELEDYSFGDVSMDFEKQELFKGNTQIEISATEMAILKYFIQFEGEVVTRHQLLDDVWGYENFPTTRTVDNFILSIRKKIEDDPSHPKHLLTIHKAGYKFVK